MLRDEDDESAVQCRERRSRRIKRRRLTAVSGSGACSPNPIENFTDSWEGKKVVHTSSSNDEAESSEAAPSLTDEVLPVYGTLSVAGRSREMEDAVSVRTNLCRPEINGRRPVHFFAVFDGHGGHQVAALCREKMHIIMEEELMCVKGTGQSASGGEEREGLWRTAMKRCFERMDEEVVTTCLCGGTTVCCCHPMDVSLMGSTAVVAVLTPEHIFVANCGDSRAVLCRDGRALPLSIDQKPDREDERARIEACGGRVVFASGARVEGILAMSRAIGDKLLKPVVTSEPEISITKREPEDECLILASDGLWDVLSSELACEIAHECLRANPGAASRERELNPGPPRIGEDRPVAGAFHSTRSASAAALLTRLALGRKSADNISVVVVDLRN